MQQRRTVRIGLVVVAFLAAGLTYLAGGGSAADAAAVTTFQPVADTTVDATAPTVTAGSARALIADGNPRRVVYLRFDVSGTTGNITAATLRVHAQDNTVGSSPSGGLVSTSASHTWSEATTNWNNRPATGPVIARGGAVARNAWVAYDVRPVVTGNGLVTFAIAQDDWDGLTLDAREGGAAVAPQLVVTTDTSAPPPVSTSQVTRAQPVADTSVDSSQPATAAGSSIELAADGSPQRVVYLRFTLGGLTGPVTKARLWLHVRNTTTGSSPSGGTISRVPSSTWSEAGTTWANRPTVGTALSSVGNAPRDGWVEFDVAGAVTGNGTVDLAITTTNGDDVGYDSRESLAPLRPELVVTSWGPAPTTTTTTTPTTTTTKPTTTTTKPATPATVTMLAAGDIAGCTWDYDEQTAQILDRYPSTTPIAALGDTVQVAGTAAEFRDCFTPTWGRHKAQIRPTIGNHEYLTDNGGPYWDYFGAAAGDRGKGWYSYDVGAWHVVVLNGNCWKVGGCQKGSPQETWLRADLAANRRPCTLAYWHQPYFSSIERQLDLGDLWQALYDNNVELLLNGHKHGYERFAPQRPDGTRDDARGVRQITVATGGSPYFYAFGAIQPNSETHATNLHGVLKLDLSATGYSWQFLPTPGVTFADSGTTACH